MLVVRKLLVGSCSFVFDARTWFSRTKAKGVDDCGNESKPFYNA